MFGFSHRIVAGRVDDLNLFQVSVQKLAPDSKDVTAATVVLLDGHRLRETRPGAGRTANERHREIGLKIKKRNKERPKQTFPSSWLFSSTLQN